MSNVAGVDPKRRIGEGNGQGNHLIKVACDAAKGRRECLQIFGTDFPTPDGTAVRDPVTDDLVGDKLSKISIDYVANLEEIWVNL